MSQERRRRTAAASGGTTGLAGVLVAASIGAALRIVREQIEQGLAYSRPAHREWRVLLYHLRRLERAAERLGKAAAPPDRPPLRFNGRLGRAEPSDATSGRKTRPAGQSASG